MSCHLSAMFIIVLKITVIKMKEMQEVELSSFVFILATSSLINSVSVVCSVVEMEAIINVK